MLKKLLATGLLSVGLALSGQAFAEPMDIMIPAGPGGGYDGTGRMVAEGLEKTKLFTDGANFTNKPGGGGMIALAEFVSRNKGNDNGLFSMGVIMVGAVVTTKSPVTLDTLTPLARLTREFDVIAVPADSPIKDVKGFA